MKKENYERLRLCVYRIKILKGNFVEALRQVDKATEIFPLDHMEYLILDRKNLTLFLIYVLQLRK